MTDFLVILIQLEIGIIVAGCFMLLIRIKRNQQFVRQEPYLRASQASGSSKYSQYDKIEKE